MSEDQVVAVFSAPAALDAAGTTVPTSLTAQNNKITMTVSHQGGGYAYPILADPTASDAKASRRGTYGISSNKYQLYQKQQWDESQLATGPLRPRVARRNVPWDYALTSQSTDSRAPEGSPNDGGDAHIIDWIQNAHARGLKVVLTLDDERGPSPPPDAPTYASAFKAWLNWSATSHVKLWGAWNEPNNPTVPTNDSLGHARLAADYWGMADHLCGEGRRCTVYAGEFSGIGYYSKQSRDRPTAPTQRRYIMEYRDRIIRRYYNKRNPPAWAVHDYADGVHAKDNNPNPFGAFMRPFLDSTDALGDPRLGHPHVIVLEAGVALRLAGKDTVLKTAKNGAHLQSLAAHDILNLHTNPTLHNRVDLVSYYTYLPDPPTGPFDSGLLNYPGNARDPYCPTGQQRPAWYILTGNQPSSC